MVVYIKVNIKLEPAFNFLYMEWLVLAQAWQRRSYLLKLSAKRYILRQKSLFQQLCKHNMLAQ